MFKYFNYIYSIIIDLEIKMNCWAIVQKVHAVLRHAAAGAAPHRLGHHLHRFGHFVARPVEQACRQAVHLMKPMALAVTAGMIVAPALQNPIPSDFVRPSVIAPLPEVFIPQLGGFFEPASLSALGFATPLVPPAMDSTYPAAKLAESLPEPGTMALLVAGMAGLVLARIPRGLLPLLRIQKKGDQPGSDVGMGAVARAMARKSTATRLAPPTNAPPTSGTASSDAALEGFTDPP